ncbi:MAG: cell wall-binding repeat-containing protein [Actinobacteria bacterium]|nr:cell wall-binding repeat-containing protein [Actinomycetota bacterium]
MSARTQRGVGARTPTILLLLVLTAVAWVLPLAPSSSEPPSTRTRHVTVAPPGQTGAARWAIAERIDAGDAVLVGADWGGDHDVEVEVRARRGQRWDPWQELHLPDDHGPDPGSTEAERAVSATVSDPVWLGPSDEIEVRVRGQLQRPVDLTLVEVGGGDGLAYTPPQLHRGSGTAHAATTQPEILSRASWGANEDIRKYVPLYAGDARFAVVHHTAGSNSYSREEADDVVRAIYSYHVESRGWDDIAYNFLIDRYGTIYEGRSGGITEAVIGAHAAGWNEGSFGVAVMGDFTSTEPTQASLDALDRLLAWKLDVHHINPHGETTEIAGGGSSNRYDRGDRVTFPTIIGHRTNNHTTCPGERLFDHVIGSDPIADRVEAIGLPKAYGGLPAAREQPQVGNRPNVAAVFTDDLDWQFTIRDEETGELVRSTGGVHQSEVDLVWDLRDAAGTPVPPGAYVAELQARLGTDEITPVTTEIEVTPPAERRGGETRIETAVELSRWAFPSARRVVIAAASAYPDALVATPLAGSFGGPVLLVDRKVVPEVVIEEIRRLGADEAWIVGGTARISKQVEEQLVRETRVPADAIHRRAGIDRFETAAAVAETVIAREDPTEVLLALGAHPDDTRAFPDALSAGAFGAEFDLPVLLTQGTFLPARTREVLASRPWEDGIRVFGGEAAVSAAVADAARDAASGTGVFRFAGADRYDTSRLAAEETLRRWQERIEEEGPDPNDDPTGLEVVLSSGLNWPDALGAGAAADRRNAVFLLVHAAEVGRSAAVQEWLTDNAVTLAHGLISGGPEAVDDEVVDAIGSIIASAGPHQDDPETWAPDPFAPQPEPSPTAIPTLP